MTRRFGGLGLGLVISRSLAEAHGGRLVAASPGKGQGATFTLELPFVAPPTPIDRLRHADLPTLAAAPAAAGPLRILLVEDNADTLRVMSRLLRGQGPRPSPPADGVAAATRAAEEPAEFDLLISDLGLPDGSGLDLIRGLSPDPPHSPGSPSPATGWTTTAAGASRPASPST